MSYVLLYVSARIGGVSEVDELDFLKSGKRTKLKEEDL